MRRSTSVLRVVSRPTTLSVTPLAVVTVPRRHLNWQRIQTKWTAKPVIDSWRKLEADVNTLKFTARSLPKEVQPIDWAFYSSKIKDKATLEKIKKEYESKVFDTPAVSFEETDRHIAKMEKWYTYVAEKANRQIPMLEAKIEELQEEKSTVGFWSTSDVFFKFPGLEEQLALRSGRGRLKNRYTPHTRIAVFDFSEARKALKEGRKPEGLPPPLRSVGDFNRDEWDRRQIREMEHDEEVYRQIMGEGEAAAAVAAPVAAIAAPAAAAAKH